MILSCKMAYQKFYQAQWKKKSSSESNKRKLKEEEIGSAKQKKLDLINKAMEEIEADIEEYSVQAIGKKDWIYKVMPRESPEQ